MNQLPWPVEPVAAPASWRPVTGRQCSTPQCGRPVRARGLCCRCYIRWYLRLGGHVQILKEYPDAATRADARRRAQQRWNVKRRTGRPPGRPRKG